MVHRSAGSVFDKLARRGVALAFLSNLIISVISTGAASWNEDLREYSGLKNESDEGRSPDTPYSWLPGQLVGPEQLSQTLADPGSQKPWVLCVGPNILFRSGHIPEARRIGPAAQPGGAENLQKQVSDIPRPSQIVIYCGCCPWEHCPNVRPAFLILEKMGFTNVKALHILHNFKQDWTDKGFAVQPGE